MLSCPRVGQNLKILMEKQPPKDKVHFHYEHNDSCKLARWTSRECYQYMYARPWQKVNDFYSDMVKGNISVSDLFKKEMNLTIHHGSDAIEDNHKSELECVPTEERTGRWARVTFKIVLSYHGASFDGWQKQPGLNTVQGIVERSLGKFVDEKKAKLLKEKKLPLEGCAVVAGRTDKGVTAFQQVCSFYTWRKDVKPQEIEDSINNAEPRKVRVISVAEVSREFHPNFSAKWRRYLYIFPFNNGDESELGNHCHKDEDCKNIFCTQDVNSSYSCERSSQFELDINEDGIESRNKPTKFEVGKINQIMQQLEGKLLSYKMFARDTKASRNMGPPTECFVFHARATEASLPCEQDGNCTKVLCIELVANRFLRKMVRVLVATAVREAAAGASDDALLKLMDATCRRATAPPAPPDGLCLVDVGYTEFNPQICFIS